MPDTPNHPRLRDLSLGLRLGLTFLIIALLGGLFASLVFMYDHYRNRDEEPELTLRDLEGAYRGATIPAPLLTALQRNHPPALPQPDRDMLLAWLRGPSIPENYENFDMGPPADLIATNCASCHTRAAAADPASGIKHSLEVASDVLAIARTRDMQPTPTRVMVISTHAHAISLALVGAMAIAFLHFSFWPRWLAGLLGAVIGIGLTLDIASWWLTRYYAEFLYTIVAGGAMFNGGVGLAMTMTMIELWRPRFARRS